MKGGPVGVRSQEFGWEEGTLNGDWGQMRCKEWVYENGC